jgi:pyruvate/2-oxoglutarate dehydrogenase complex dihydrolipoamide dehydrogenase (E3) component
MSTSIVDSASEPELIQPLDRYNRSLLAAVHPTGWVNPQPAARYDLVVIGGGTAGLVTAAGAAGLGLGLKVALIEKHLMGGDCLNVGCVPSKCLIRSARAVADIQSAAQFGVHSDRLMIAFPAVMERLRRLRAEISENDSVERFQKLGVDVFLGQGSFTGEETIAVAGATLHFKKAVITTGARASQPKIPGLAEAGFLTNETVFSLVEYPGQLAVIGGGPIGCELAQAFQRLSCHVRLFHRGDRLLDREDADASAIVQQRFLDEGMRLELGCEVQRVEVVNGRKVLHFQTQGKPDRRTVDQILVGTGRSPNVEGLNLEQAGVEYDRRGIKVNDYLQTTNPKIFAAGDICMDWKFTHAADAAARIVIKNALFAPFGLGRSKLSDLVMPWTTYTSPEIAHVGLYETEAKSQGIAAETIMIPFSKVDRAIADGETEGFIKILHKQGSDQILGATIVANHAGEMISEVTLAIVHNIGLSKLASVIHPYPTQAEAIKKAADAYRRTLLSDRTRSLLKLLTKFS